MSFNINDEIKKYPFARITFALIIGILIAFILNPTYNFTISFLLASVCLLVLSTLFKVSIKHGILHGILINIAIISFGLFVTVQTKSDSEKYLLYESDSMIIGEISNDPKLKGNNVIVNIDIIALKNDDNWHSTTGKTLLYIENDNRAANLKPGDKIIFSPSLSEIQNKGNPEEFDYKKYLAFNLIHSSDFLSGDDWKLLNSDKKTDFRHNLLRFRQNLISNLSDSGLSDDELSVISALALGYKDSLSDEIRHSYSSSGAMHILAVSGLHVGIIYGIIIFLLSFAKSEKLKYYKLILTIILIWLYAMLTGLSPSVSRAALMFSIMALGSVQKHKAGSLNAIAISAFILLVINPYNITNIGFQLSYAAVIGIIILYPKIYAILTVKNKFLDKIWSLTAVSIAAQIATAPIGLYYFNQFSNYFLLANYFLIPLSTIAIWLVIFVFIASAIGFGAVFLSKILAYIVKAMNSITMGIESLPFSVSSDIYISFPQLLVLYIAIIFFAFFFFESKRYRHFVIVIISLIVYSAFSLSHTLQTSKQQYIIVYNINKTTAINIIDGTDNILFAGFNDTDKKQIEFSAKNNWLKKGLDKEKYIDIYSDSESILTNIATIDNQNVFFKRKFIEFNGYRIFVIDDEFYAYFFDEDFEKMDIDFLVLSKSANIKLSQIASLFNFKTLIIDSSNTPGYIENLMIENEETEFDIHNVRKDGAFVFKIS